MKKKNFGFTLIELLVVIAIIGLLASLIMVNFNAARERARDVQRKSDLDQVKKALRMYYNDNNLYPTSNASNQIVGCIPVKSFAWGSPFQCSMIYMKLLPQDPTCQLSTGIPTYKYQGVTVNQDFCLWATLENKSDGDIAKSKTRCSGCGFNPNDTTPIYVVCAD
jgi:type II secretion system protein G